MTQRPGPGEDAVGIAAGEGFEIVAVETQFGTASLTVNGNVNLTGKLVFQDHDLNLVIIINLPIIDIMVI